MSEVMCIHCPAVVKETDTTCVSCGGQLKDKEQGNGKTTEKTNHAPSGHSGKRID